MTARLHRDFDAYAVCVPNLEQARLFSLKLEYLEIAAVRRRYVDAILINGDRLVAAPFILIAQNGEAVLHERHLSLHDAVCEWLVKTAADWAASKGVDATLEADLFDTDTALRAEVLDVAGKAEFALPGLSPYAALFTEAERYANVTPFAIGKTVIDFNPGVGYGPKTLVNAASSVAIHPSKEDGLLKRFYPQLAMSEKGADVAVWLNVNLGEIDEAVDALRAAVHADGFAIVSAKGADAADGLRSAGADVLQMTRPGCEGLGELDEWLGVFRNAPAPVHFSPATEAQPLSRIEVTQRPLRVLFALRPSAESIFGGDVVQVRETANALRERGHFTEVSTAPILDASGFDIVHLSNMTVPQETLSQAQSIAGFDGPVVMMPIFTDHCDEAVWGMNAVMSIYALHQDLGDLRQKLEMVELRRLSVGAFLPPPQRMDITEGYTLTQKAALGYVDFIIANAHSEVHRIYRYLTCDIPYAVAPSCANPRVYGAWTRRGFVERFGFEDFVLLAGRYEARKNQLNFFEATHDMNLPLLFIGNNRNAAFARIVQMHRPGKAAYIGHLSESDLAGAFAAARVVAIPSWDEVVSLTSLNAAISGASMVLSRNSYEHEYFMDDAEYCDPGSVRSIAASLRRAWDTHESRRDRRAALSERVIRDFNWQRSAALTEEAYYRVLAYNPRGDARRSRFAGAPGRG